jgi:hypothetical protein
MYQKELGVRGSRERPGPILTCQVIADCQSVSGQLVNCQEGLPFVRTFGSENVHALRLALRMEGKCTDVIDVADADGIRLLGENECYRFEDLIGEWASAEFRRSREPGTFNGQGRLLLPSTLQRKERQETSCKNRSIPLLFHPCPFMLDDDTVLLRRWALRLTSGG